MSLKFESLIQQIVSVSHIILEILQQTEIYQVFCTYEFSFCRESQKINKYVINKNKTVIGLKIYGRCCIKRYLSEDKKKYEKQLCREEHFMQREQ